MSNGCWIAKLPQQLRRRTNPHRRRYRRSTLDQICKPCKTLTNKTLTHNKSLIWRRAADHIRVDQCLFFWRNFTTWRDTSGLFYAPC
jgi:hypothetical protein